jgi:2-oxoglutarate dehydrogenase E1 component
MMKEFLGNSYLFGSNAPFIEQLYDAYLKDPQSVEPGWRSYFDELQRLDDGPPDVSHEDVQQRFIDLAKSRRPAAAARAEPSQLGQKQFSVLQLISAYRTLGVRVADVDPLDRVGKPYIQELDPAFYGLSDADMQTVFNTGSLVWQREATLEQILGFLRNTYCGSIGFEYMYMTDIPQRRWVQERVESVQAQPAYDAEYKKHILERLTAAETLEKYLHTRYVGQKRFSGEGGESVIAQLDLLLQRAGKAGVQELVIGMAHRGRLGVLVNTLGKMPKDLFAEFEGKHDDHELLAGDVKYHMGFSSNIMTPGGPMHVTLAFNPSHLEIVNPVVEGSVRARQHRRKDYQGDQVLPVLLHGDAAFAGQGITQETLNLAQTRGYGTGGTVHIVVNNQIGFTTSDIRDVRSTLYCTDVAKMLEVPIFHVNGDDPEAVCLVTEIALDYRMRFHKDAVIDVVCYRRLGHNEQDEPMVTQPLMYKRIAKLPTTRKLYADKLEREGVVREGEADEMIATFRKALDAGYHTNKTILSNYKPPFEIDWSKYKGGQWHEHDDTRLPLEKLKALADRITTVPDNFKLHPRVQKIIDDRRLMAKGELPLDWGMAEHLAFATLLDEGYPIRLSGQDSGRGTFFHRHAVLHDQNRERWDQGAYIPLQHVSDKTDFVVIDSLLSEEGVLGFEYGYATSSPNELVIWEAQFGDFANGAQVVIDQFIASGEVKWGRMCGLVMMLPHGYEGQGPEHSSARIERYMQLCADYNMQICVPATPVQLYYLLRRQMLRPYRKPLIIFTPKSLLRHKESVSPLEEFATDKFRAVNEDWDAKDIDPSKVQRVVFCSGKVYYDLRAGRKAKDIENLPLVRIAQLYPFPHEEMKGFIERYKNATEIVWCQEEPRNQGAWHRIQHYLLRHLLPHQKLYYAGRDSSASPAAGYKQLHDEQQKALVEQALTLSAGSEPRIRVRPLLAGEDY